jgi:glyoxylase-like metal-dependent hydrolase (beta-lactamase superfamily II)
VRATELNCGTLRPPGAAMVCRVLLLESVDGIALVDTGFGTGDVADPARLGPVRHLLRPALRREETAVAQLAARGIPASAVTDVVLTHGDLDHAGGITDFPGARVHLTAAELPAVRRRRGLLEAQRYRPAQWSPPPRLIGHPPGDGAWHGLPGAIDLSRWVPGVVMVPLPGHTAGHAGIAVRTDGGWLLHAGDALRSGTSLLTGTRPDVRLRQRLLAADPAALRATQGALARLLREHPEVRVVASHAPPSADPGRP